MIALVVDDEPTQRDGLIKHIKWSELGYNVPLEAKNATVALEIARKQKIDVLIADICMPGTDGIQMAKLIKEIHPQIRILIISGYEEFEYARSALEVGIRSYLLKPLQLQEVEKWLLEFRKEVSMYEAMTEADSKVRIQLEKSLTVAKERFVQELMDTGCLSGRSLQNWLNLLDLPQEPKNWRLAVISPDQYFRIIRENPRLASAITPRISSAVDTVLTGQVEYFSGIMTHDRLAIMIFPDGITNFDIMEPLNLVKSLFEENEETTLTICLSEPLVGWQQASDCFMKMMGMIDEARLYSDSQFILMENHTMGMVNPWSFDSLVKNVIEAMQSTVPLDAMKYITTAFDMCLESEDGRLQNAQAFCIQIINVVAMQSGKELMTVNAGEVYKRVLGCTSLNGLREYFLPLCSGQLSNRFDLQKKKMNQTIEQARKYLETNLEKNITVRELADIVHMNASYLSVLFKKETGETISDYSLRIRIQQAKLLILTTSLKIYEIGEKVGYQTTSYFINQFKLVTGYTPSDYRESRPS